MLVTPDGELVDTPDKHAHFVRFYDDDARLLDEVVEFIDSALRAGGTGIVVAGSAHAAQLRPRLAALGDPGGRPGQLIMLDAQDTLDQFMVDGWPDEQRFQDTVGGAVARLCAAGGTVHAFGEMVALLCAQGHYDAAVRLEQMWNALGRQCRFSLFCAYPWQLFPTTELAGVFQQVCDEHDHACSHSYLLLPAGARGRHTELARLEQRANALEGEVARRKEAEHEVSAASHAKDEFLAMLGHELRNPLSPIVTALQLMEMRGEAGSARERGIIGRQVGHLVRLVDDLLDVSRVTRGKIELAVERMALAQPLATAVEMVRPLLEQRGHRFDTEVEPGLCWEGDPVRLAQAVGNLLSNAARYTEPGGHIVLRAGREDAHWLRIAVADTGAGLAPEMLAQVFDLFFQGERALDRAEGGLGIGLALVKTIAELHGGTVEARSAGKGQGSEFVVRLPACAPAGAMPAGPGPPAAATALTGPVPAPSAPIPSLHQRRRIMVVDDNVDAADTLAQLLAGQGHQVEAFHDPLAALAALERLQPEVCILDIGLPRLDGYQLARRIRERMQGRPCRLVALSGYGQAADKAKSRDAGFDLHLVKPIRPEQLDLLAQ